MIKKIGFVVLDFGTKWQGDEPYTGLAQLIEYQLDCRLFWFGILQLSVDLSKQYSPSLPFDDNFRIRFEDGRGGMAFARRFKVDGEYVEIEFVGLTDLQFVREDE